MDTNPWDDLKSIVRRAGEAERSGDRELAYEYFRRATELSPNLAEGWRGRAHTSNFPDDVLLSLAYASALAPDCEPEKRAFEAKLKERLECARLTDVPALVRIGQSLGKVNYIPEASQTLRRAVELDPSKDEALVWLAAMTRDVAEAEQLLHQALTINPSSPAARAGLVSIARQLGHSPILEAARANDAAAAAGAGDALSLQLLMRQAEQSLAAGENKKAFELYALATQAAPQNGEAWLGRARAADDLDESLSCVNKAITINPESVAARDARTYFRVRKVREGMKQAVETAPPPRFRRPLRRRGPYANSPGRAIQRSRLLLIALILAIVFFLAATSYLILH